MSSDACHTQHCNQNDEMRACLKCHKRSRKAKGQNSIATNGVVPVHHPSWSPGTNVVKGTRALSETDRQLQERISEQALYRDKLEKALAELQQSISSDPHPLLTKKQSKVRVPGLLHESMGKDKGLGAKNLSHDADTDDLVETLGMMSIHNDGKRQFHGETATSEYLLKESTASIEGGHAGDETKNVLQPLQLPPELVLANILFPCPPMDQATSDMSMFLECLPPQDRAATLVHNYLSYFTWCAMPVPRNDLSRIFDIVYPNGVKTSTLCVSDAHGLAVLFMVFVLGTLYDINMEITEFSAKTEEFHSLARAAMTADPMTEHTTVEGVQAMVLMIWYFRMFPGQRSLGYQWALSGFLYKLVQAIGLHRDSSEQIPDPDERRRYEQTFWEFNCVDIWQSYMFGRPTSMISSMVDCRVPETVLVSPDHDPSFYNWKYSFSRLVSDVVGHISGTTQGAVVGHTCAAPVAYNDIIRYERSLRDHYLPSSFAWPERDEPLPTNEVAGKMFQRYLGNVWRQVSIMYLHRQYFWVAILQHAYNPSQSPYARSVSAVFHSAVSIVHGMRRLWHAHPRLIERMCPFWSHCMSAALVLGALVTKSPGYHFGEAALLHFDETCEMFEEAKDSLQPRNARTTIQKLKRKAHEAFARFHDTADQLNGTARKIVNPSVIGLAPDSNARAPFTVEFYSPPHSVSTPSESPPPQPRSASTQANPIHLPEQPRDDASLPYGLFGGMPVEYDMEQTHIGI